MTMFRSVSCKGLALLAWSLLFALPFLSRVHYVPLPQWWGEMNSVWLILVSAIFLIANRQYLNQLPRASVWMLGMAAFWALQPFWIPIDFAGLNQATAWAFFAMALLGAVTQALRQSYDEQTLYRFAAWALLIGAILQSLIGLAQVTGLAQVLGGFLFYDRAHPTTNVFGHFGQRNQYAHYLAWGMTALAYLWSEKRLNRHLACALLLWLALSMAWAGSRTVILYAVAMLGLAWLWHMRLREEASWHLAKALTIAAVAIIAMQFVVPFINHLLAMFNGGAEVASGVERLASHDGSMGVRRFAEWHKAWLVFLAHPNTGIGWSQYAVESVQLQMLPEFQRAGFNSGLFTNSHNLITQLLAEMGWPGALLAIGGWLWAIWPYCGKQTKAIYVMPLVMMSITFIHSCVEYPLWYLYFLAVLVVWTALSPAKPLPLNRLVSSVFLGMSALLAYYAVIYIGLFWLLVGLYSPAQSLIARQAQEQDLLEVIHEQPMFAFHALNTLENYIQPDAVDAQTKLKWIRALTAFRPYPEVMLKQAKLEALVGNQKAAQQTLAQALASFPTYAPRFILSLHGQTSFKALEQQAWTAYWQLPKRYQTPLLVNPPK